MAVRRQRPDRAGHAAPGRAFFTPACARSISTRPRQLSPSPAPSLALAVEPGNAAEHSTASTVDSRVLRRTTTASISPVAMPHLPPPLVLISAAVTLR